MSPDRFIAFHIEDKTTLHLLGKYAGEKQCPICGTDLREFAPGPFNNLQSTAEELFHRYIGFARPLARLGQKITP